MAELHITRHAHNFKDLAGQAFGELTVQRYAGRSDTSTGGRRAYWHCLCSCGRETIVQGAHLRTGHTTSCGHIHRLRFTGRTHGQSGTTEYQIYKAIIARCCNPRHVAHANYGGRGIMICDKWRHSFEAFLADVGPRPSRAHSLDRINNDGNYEPGNCQWATREQQNSNRRDTTCLTFNGRTQSLVQWAREIGVAAPTLRVRLRLYGWTVERALTTPTSRRATPKPSVSQLLTPEEAAIRSGPFPGRIGQTGR